VAQTGVSTSKLNTRPRIAPFPDLMFFCFMF